MSRCPRLLAREGLIQAFPGALLLLLTWLAPALAGGDSLPAPLFPFEAQYRVTNGTLQLGTTVIRLRPDPQGWRYESRTEAGGVFALFAGGPIHETSILQPHDGGLRPLEYRHDESNGKDDVRVAFDWTAGEYTVHRRGRTHTRSLEPETRDQFGVILAVIRAVAGGRDTLSVPGVDDKGEPLTLRFEVTGRERRSVPLGEYDSVRVRRVREDKRSTVIWLAPELEWLPIMIEQRKKGDLVARLELEALNGRTAGNDGEKRR